MLAYEMARQLTGYGCNYVVTVRIHGKDGEYEIKPGFFPETREDGTDGIVMEAFPISSAKEQAGDGCDGSDGGKGTGENPEKPRRFHLF